MKLFFYLKVNLENFYLWKILMFALFITIRFRFSILYNLEGAHANTVLK